MKTNLIHLFPNTIHSCHDVRLNSTGQTSFCYTRVANHDNPENLPDFMLICRTSDLYPRSIAQYSNSNSRLKNSVEKTVDVAKRKVNKDTTRKFAFSMNSVFFFKQWLGFSMPFHACNHRKKRH